MKLKKTTERGQALILIAIAMVGLVAMVGLAIDGGAKFSDRRHAQNAADTAALAAALAKVDTLAEAVKHPGTITTTPEECPPSSGSPSGVCTALLNAGFFRATSNGYNGNLETNTVEIHSPPVSGYYINDKDYVQVIITSYVNTTFARVLGFSRFTNVVQAVAYAKPGYNLADGAMIISYDPDPNCSTGGTGGYSVEVNGSSTVNLYGGGIFLNSDEVCGFRIPNCADLNITTGAGISSVGTDNINQEGCTDQAPEFPSQESVRIPDDISYPPEPPQCNPGYSTPSPTKLGEIVVGTKTVEEWLIYPGYYTDFPSPSLVANKSNIYMASGVYCIDVPHDADLSWSPVDAAHLNGSILHSKNKYSSYNPSGVTLYIKPSGGLALSAGSPTLLDATTTTSSDYQGYLIILAGTPTSHPSCTINGGADLDINGLIFAPYCNFTINGQAGETAAINAQLIGWDLKINGNNAINFNYDPSNQVKVKRKVGLMK